jgi:hypothetical protein
MKTKMFNKLAKSILIVFSGILISIGANAQFVATDTIAQIPIEERKGNTSTYTVPGPATDEYSWEVVGGTIVVPAAGVTGLGTVTDPYVVPFTVGLQSIEVEWPADDSTITSMSGNVSTQRQVQNPTVQCPSSIQSLDITFWSNPTITIQNEDYEICSGDATLGDVTVALTGAPDFEFAYTITGLDGIEGAEIPVTESGGTATIDIPDNLLNTSTTDDQYFIVTIKSMNDDFQGAGTIVDGSFTITVHPTVETGDITSSGTLTRRP